MRVVKERKLNEYYIKMKLISLLIKEDLTYTEIWDRLKKTIGSKYTLKKYLDILIEKNIVKITYKKVKTKKRKIYSLRKEFSKLRKFLDSVRKKEIESDLLLLFLELAFYISISKRKTIGDSWYISIIFSLALMLEFAENEELVNEMMDNVSNRIVTLQSEFEGEINELLDLFLEALE